MQKSEKLVSILIPSYNNERFLDDCLESLAAQTYQNIELFICDDCSTDNSWEKILQWKERLEERFVQVELLLNEKNLGVTKTLNQMLEKSRGAYIKLFASDDMFLPDGIEKLVNFAEGNEFDLIYSNIIYVPESAKYGMDVNNLSIRYTSVPVSGKKLTDTLLKGNFIGATGVLIPAETIRKYGYMDETFLYEDWEYWLRISITGSIGYVDAVTTMYRVCENSMSHFGGTREERSRRQRFSQEQLKIFLKYEKFGTKETKKFFYNRMLSVFLSLNDKDRVIELKDLLKQEKLRMSHENKMKLLLFHVGIFGFVQRTVRGIREKRECR